MNLNELKLKLSKILKNRDDYRMMKYVQSFMKTDTGDEVDLFCPSDLFQTRNSRQLYYCRRDLEPILIGNSGLTLNMSVCFDKELSKTYHEILFEEGANFGRKSTLKTGVIVPNGNKILIEIKNKTVRIIYTEAGITADENFEFSDYIIKEIVGLEFNFDKNSIKVVGEKHFQKMPVENAVLKLMQHMSLSDAKQIRIDLNSKYKSSSAESNFIKSIHLDYLLDDYSILPVLLYHFTKNSDIRSLLQNEGAAKLVFRKINRVYNSDNKDEQSQIFETNKYFKKGTTPSQIAGLDGPFAEFYCQFGEGKEDFRPDYLERYTEAFDKLQKHIPITSNEELQIIFNLTNCYGIHFYQNLGFLVYLVQCGFSIIELYQTLLEMDREQAIPYNEGLHELFKLNFLNECNSGIRQKIISDSVKKDIDKAYRLFKDLNPDTFRAAHPFYVQALDNLLKHAMLKTNGFNFESQSKEKSSYPRIDYVLDYKLSVDATHSSSGETNYIRFYGLAITGTVNRPLSTSMKTLVKKWAENVGIYIDSLRPN